MKIAVSSAYALGLITLTPVQASNFNYNYFSMIFSSATIDSSGSDIKGNGF